MGQLAEAKNRLAEAGTEAEQAKVMIGVLERDLKEKEPKAKKAAKEGEGLTKEFAAAKNRLQELQASIEGMNFDEKRQTELLRLQAEHSEQITVLSQVSQAAGFHRMTAPTHQLMGLYCDSNATLCVPGSPASSSRMRTLIPASIAARSREWLPTLSVWISKDTKTRWPSRSALVASFTISSLRMTRQVAA
jgi:hypothetical protein